MVEYLGTKLTTIIPVFNGQRTICRALDSVLLQDTNFEHEVIVVDDKSTDDTVKVIQGYLDKYPNIRLIQNEQNTGKGFSVMRAYEAASGSYVHILDADDYFISYNKLQKQVDFLEQNPDYVAVAHNSLLLFSDGRVSFISDFLQEKSFSYEQAVTSRFYFHTSSYMFRKVAKALPDIFLEEPMRGDSGFFFYHVFVSKKKVKYFPDISSVYNFHGDGIWSGISDEKKYSIMVKMFSIFMESIIIDKSTWEYKAWAQKARKLTEQGRYIPSAYEKRTLDQVLEFCRTSASRIYSPDIREKAFSGVYGLRVVDQLCEAVGRVIFSSIDYQTTVREFNDKKTALLISGFSIGGGGVFREIKEIVKLFLAQGKSVEIYSTNQIDFDKQVVEEHFNDPRISFFEVNKSLSYSEQVKQLISALFTSAPGEIYPYISHHDVIANAVVQRGLGGAIILDFVFDHGLSLGINNTSLDRVIVKTISQAESLDRVIPAEKLMLIPPFMEDKFKTNPYQPLRRDKLVTATAAARQYKIDSSYTFSFEAVIARIIRITGGTHIHYGPLTEDFKERINTEMRKIGVARSQFLHIEWVNDFPGSLIAKGVDVFVASFPIPSALILVNVMMCGIPIVVHNVEGSLMPYSGDFCDPEQFSWRVPEDLYRYFAGISMQELFGKSASARRYYETYNSAHIANAMILQGRGMVFELPEIPRSGLRDLTESDFYELDGAIFKNILKPAGQNSIIERGIRRISNDRRFEPLIRPLTRIRGFLGWILPTPSRSFHRAISSVINETQTAYRRLRWNDRQILRELEELKERRSRKEAKEYKITLSELGEIKEVKLVLQQILERQISFSKEINHIQGSLSELLWAQIYNNTIQDSNWLKSRAVSPGRWAVGYPFLYVLYRILNEVMPQSILELGIGQSTKIIGEYVKAENSCTHFVVEDDKDWVSLFLRTYTPSKRTNIFPQDLVSLPYDDEDICVRQYDESFEKFSQYKFDLLIVDGPGGTLDGKYSRIDVLKILPECLMDSFVIMVDDTHRKGEFNTVKKIEETLSSRGVDYLAKEYRGQKHFCVLVSADLGFITSL